MNIFSLGATWLTSILDYIWLSICQVIYVFINWLYQVFETVANVNLFSEEVFSDITSRIYIIMGIAMLFIFAYNLVLMIVNPDDKKGTGSTTKLVKDTIVSLIVIVLLPTIFNYMYVFQSHILSSNIIGQIIMGGIGSTSGDTSNCDPDDYECSCDFSDFEELKKYGTGEDKNLFAHGFTEGSTDVHQNLVTACNKYKNDYTDSQRGAFSIAPTIFSAFYRPATYDMLECEEYLKTGSSSIIDTDQKKQICANFFYDIKMSKYTGNINAFVTDDYLRLTRSTDDGLVEFDWIFAILAGGLAVWMFLCYAMEIGVRVAKLGVLQIISPIAVMMRIVPSKGGGENQMFSKWLDELKKTYLDVFIRLVIIYFALFAISLVPDVIATLFSSVYSGEANWFLQTLSLVIVILGILKFAQEAPELLKTFFGGSGSGRFSIKPKDQHGLNALRAGVYGATTGNGWKDRIGGFFSGTARGAFGGYDKAVKGIDTARTEYDNGSRWYNRAIERARVGIGMETRGERDTRNINRVQAKVDDNSSKFKSLDEIKAISSKAIEKNDSTVRWTVNGSFGSLSGNYQSLVNQGNTLLDEVNNAKTAQEKADARRRYDEFITKLEETKKSQIDAGIKALLEGTSAERAAFDFKDGDIGAVTVELSKLKGLGEEIGNFSDYSQLKKDLGKEKQELATELSQQYSEKYTAKQADTRRVRNTGKSEKK